MPDQRGAKNPFWRGGRSIASNGYVLVRVGRGHRLSDVRGYAYEHRVIAEKMLGRALAVDEVVHHKNGRKRDNRPSNLEVLGRAAHRTAHRRPGSRLRVPGEPNARINCACGCRAELWKYDEAGRPRSFITGHNLRCAKHANGRELDGKVWNQFP